MEVVKKQITAIGNGYIRDFKIDEYNVKQIENIIRYFYFDPNFEGEPEKGLLLIGPKGTGKTLIMVIMQKLLTMLKKQFMVDGYDENCNTFGIEPTHRITAAYESTGHPGIMKYTEKNIFCFDDLGEEEKLCKYYTNEINVMAKVLTDRYFNFVTKALITHATSNYPLVDTKTEAHYYLDFYGARVEDRMTEMFNVIVFKGNSRRK